MVSRARERATGAFGVAAGFWIAVGLAATPWVTGWALYACGAWYVLNALVRITWWLAKESD